jgi:FMN phosphatase YigB (HAD superfamily)
MLNRLLTFFCALLAFHCSFFAHSEVMGRFTHENTIIAWDFHDVIAYKPMGAMVWESINFIKNASNRWELIKLSFSPSFVKELWSKISAGKSGDRIIEEIIALYPHELAQHKEKIYAIATMHFIHPEMIDVIMQLKKLGYIQVLASNIGAESLPRMQQKYPELFALFDGLFYDGALNKNGVHCTCQVKPNVGYYQGLKEFLMEHRWQQPYIIFIDDKKENIEGAFNANVGIVGIQFLNPAQLRKEFGQLGTSLACYNEQIKMQTTC